jgi:hypothetical protein
MHDEYSTNGLRVLRRLDQVGGEVIGKPMIAAEVLGALSRVALRAR